MEVQLRMRLSHYIKIRPLIIIERREGHGNKKQCEQKAWSFFFFPRGRNVPCISRVNWTMHPSRFAFPKWCGPLYRSKTFDWKMPLGSGLEVGKAKVFLFKKSRKIFKTFCIFHKKWDFKGNLYLVSVTLSHQKVLYQSYWLVFKSRTNTKFFSQPKHLISSKHIFLKQLRCSATFNPCWHSVSLKILSLVKLWLQKRFWLY